MVATICKKLIHLLSLRAVSERRSEREELVLKAATYGLVPLNPHAAMGKLGKREWDAVSKRECVVLEWSPDRRHLPVLTWKHRTVGAGFDLAIQISLWSQDRNAIGLRFEVGEQQVGTKNPHRYWHCQLFDIQETYGKWPRRHAVGRNCQAFLKYPAIPIPASDAAGMVLSALLSVYGQQKLQAVIDSDESLKDGIGSIMKTRLEGVGLQMYPDLSSG